jgi:hypothetical protein
MKAENVEEPISYGVAIEICRAIRAEAEINWTTASARWCYACREARKDWAKTPGFSDKPGNRGCMLVNTRYALIQTSGTDVSQ